VTDDWDRRLLLAVLGRFCCEDILREDFRLSSSGLYTLPPGSTLDTAREHIARLPAHEDPEVFGMQSVLCAPSPRVAGRQKAT